MITKFSEQFVEHLQELTDECALSYALACAKVNIPYKIKKKKKEKQKRENKKSIGILLFCDPNFCVITRYVK